MLKHIVEYRLLRVRRQSDGCRLKRISVFRTRIIEIDIVYLYGKVLCRKRFNNVRLDTQGVALPRVGRDVEDGLVGLVRVVPTKWVWCLWPVYTGDLTRGKTSSATRDDARRNMRPDHSADYDIHFCWKWFSNTLNIENWTVCTCVNVYFIL